VLRNPTFAPAIPLDIYLFLFNWLIKKTFISPKPRWASARTKAAHFPIWFAPAWGAASRRTFLAQTPPWRTVF